MPWFKTNRTLASVDLQAYLDEEDEEYDREQFHKRTANLRADIRQYGSYLDHRKNGLTHPQAELAANFKMAATKRKSTSSSGGASKKTKTAKVKYGGGEKKFKDKHNMGKVDWNEVAKIADKVAKKEINKNIETQYSQMMVTMTHTAEHKAVQGFDLGGLNFDQANLKFKPDQAMIFNMCYLSQPGSSLMPGYRLGQRINAKYFKITLTANLPQVSADCTYHMRIVRRKSDRTGQSSYGQPTIANISNLELFKANTDGPLAAGSSYGNGATAQTPFPYFASAMRPNTEAWTFVQKGHVQKYVKGMPIDIDTNDDKYVASFCETLYFPLEEEWEFVNRTGSDIKGGNYFLILWREGGPDFVQYTASPVVTEALGQVQLKVSCELAFKDG
jgi:hypothetical protein